MPRVFVGTLYSGENEFDECVDMLNNQTYHRWEHLVIKGLENKAAHDKLYREFMAHSSEFDIFLKLDADMVFRHATSLEELVRLFESMRDVDHLYTPVLDWYSGAPIPALHMFSNRATWSVSGETLFVDGAPTIPGRRMHVTTPFVIHSPNPSRKQAFLFGVHRAVKAVQPGVRRFRRGQASLQWHILINVWKHFVETSDIRLGICMFGADQVFQGLATHQDYLQREVDEAMLGQYTFEQLHALLVDRWGSPIIRELMHKRLIAWRFLRSLVEKPPNVMSYFRLVRNFRRT